WDVLAQWRSAGRMVLLSAHDLALLERRVDRLCVLRAGKVVAVDTPAELRRMAALPHRVHLQMAEHANGALQDFREAAEALGGRVELDGLVLRAEIEPATLLRLLDLRERFPGLVVDLRVEEPPLDLVYEHLLEEASP
ncbi:MAG: hypothetical protein OEY14_00395, partial [Myxococcales bacterium]|nr:hypothetical protein [Myxococcales bacterium]